MACGPWQRQVPLLCHPAMETAADLAPLHKERVLIMFAHIIMKCGPSLSVFEGRLQSILRMKAIGRIDRPLVTSLASLTVPLKERGERAWVGWIRLLCYAWFLLTNTRPSQRICGNVVSSPSLVASSINQQQHLAHWNSLLICVDFAKAMRRGGLQRLSTVRSGHAAGREMAHPPAALYCSVRARRRQGKEP